MSLGLAAKNCHIFSRFRTLHFLNYHYFLTDSQDHLPYHWINHKIGVLKHFNKFHRKTPVLESLFNKVVGLKA